MVSESSTILNHVTEVISVSPRVVTNLQIVTYQMKILSSRVRKKLETKRE